MPKISVLIVNYNAGDRLRRCLAHLGAQTFKDFEIIVIDNGSQDESLSAARAAGVPFQLIDAGENLGFAAGNNRAAEAAAGEWLAFLNPDAYAAPDWLQTMVEATERYPFADAFGSTQLMADDASVIDGAGDCVHICGVNYRGHHGWPGDQLPGDGEVFSPCAAAALYRKSSFDAIGGFDERFFCYGEDVDLGFRLRLAGGRAVQVADAVVRHEGSAISGRESEFSIYHGHRNRIWLSYKNTPAALYWPLLPVRLAADLSLLLRFGLKGKAGVYCRAIKDGYAGLQAFRQDRAAIAQRRAAAGAKVAHYFVWSPLAIFRREAVLRPIAATETAD